MRLAYIGVLAAAWVLGSLAMPPVGAAAEPPNQDDPCSVAGRDTCGTLGVGFHDTYRYGVRWFGDFRGAVPGEPHTFCLDLRFWYASPAYRYREAAGPALANADGEAVPVRNQRKLAYAVWNYGRSRNADQQAAVALYVHALMGDARPGEVDPAALKPAVVSRYKRVARDAVRYHGPYQLDVRLSDQLAVGQEGQATIRVLSSAGVALPDVPLELSAQGARALSAQVRTNADGTARAPFTPTRVGSVRLTVETGTVASTLPRVFAATTAAAAGNAQRLAAPASQTLTVTKSAPVKRPIHVSTETVRAELVVGEVSRDRVTIRGALPTWRATVAVQVHGPFATADAIRCDGAPVWEGSFVAHGPGVFTTRPVKLGRVGWYTYREVVPGDADHAGLTTPCGVPSETFRVAAQPEVTTAISSQTAQSGTTVFDRVRVKGLAGQSATVRAALYGPFPTRKGISCRKRPMWSGSFAVDTDGEYQTEPVTLTDAGFYTYKEWIVADGFVRPTATGCGEKAETTVVRASPSVTTVVSSKLTSPGATIFDRIEVSGLGTATAQIQVELFGPFPSMSALRCEGHPYWAGTVTATADGELRSPGVKVTQAGFYTYRERVLETPVIAGSKTACALAPETSLAAPLIATGRRSRTRGITTANPSPSAPMRLRLASVEIDVPLTRVGIDVERGVLDVPADIAQAGWWRDGMAPGAKAGAILIAAHVDSAAAGPGAFFSLRRAKPGDEVQLTGNGRTFTYRVATVRNHRRNALPLSVFSRDGAPRLVLVTCGGPFDADSGHYRDNVVLTAFPTDTP